jgi:DNA repair exonuclease SbcCD nuclease subunit
MKLAFVADTHFGYPRFQEDALNQGTTAILDAASKADVLLIGGDIFDHRVPRLEVLADVASLFKRANELLPDHAFSKILGIHGTHEMRSKGSLNPIQMLCRLGLMEDVHNKTILLQKGEDRVTISGMGGIPDDLVSDALKRLSCNPQKEAYNLFLFHQTMAEYVPQAKDLASIEELPEGFDLFLCGHIHSRKTYLGSKLLIPGSTVLTQLRDEDQEEKGYLLIDSNTRDVQFIPINTRPYEVHTLEFSEAQPSQIRIGIQKKLTELLKKDYPQKPILKIKLEGSLHRGNNDIDLSGFESEKALIYIENNLSGNSLVSEIEKLKSERLNNTSPIKLGLSLLEKNCLDVNLNPKKAIEFFEMYSKEE